MIQIFLSIKSISYALREEGVWYERGCLGWEGVFGLEGMFGMVRGRFKNSNAMTENSGVWKNSCDGVYIYEWCYIWTEYFNIV